jgi:Methyltransferase FkbM domain
MMRVSKTRSNGERNERRRRHYIILVLTFVVIAVVALGGVQLTSYYYDDASHTTPLSDTLQALVLGGGGEGTTLATADKATGRSDAVAVSRRIKQQQQQPLLTVKTKATPCARQSLPELAEKKWLQSQSREDEHLLQHWFNGLCGGTYLEMGALDGIQFSNSFVFQKALQWKGLLVELAPRNFAKLVKNRPLPDITVHAAVCSPRRTVHYYQHPHKSLKALSGVYEFTSESFRKTYWTGLTPGSFEGTKEIQCIPLQDIIQEHIIAPKLKAATTSTNNSDDDDSVLLIDFFSLDVEGGEMAVLQSIDHDKVVFGIILVEADEHNLLKNMAMRTYVERQGYTFLGEFERSYWFVHEQFDLMYQNALHAEGGGGGGTSGAAAPVQ